MARATDPQLAFSCSEVIASDSSGVLRVAIPFRTACSVRSPLAWFSLPYLHLFRRCASSLLRPHEIGNTSFRLHFGPLSPPASRSKGRAKERK